MIFQPKTALFAAAFCLVPVLNVMAQKAATDPRISTIAPFVDEATVAIGRLDLSKLDLKGGLDRVVKEWAIPDDQALQAKDGLKVVESVRQQLLTAGAKEIYAFVNSGGEDEEPFGFVVLPVAAGKDPAAVIEVLKSLPGVDVTPFVLNKAVIIAPPEAKERVEGIEAQDRPEISAAFAAAGSTDLQLFFFPNEAILEDIKTATPGDEGDEEIEEYAGSLTWLALTANLPPKPAFSLITAFEDEESAEEIMGELKELLAQDAVKELQQDPTTAKAIEALTPKRQKNQLRLVLSEANGGIKAVADGIRVNLEKALSAAQQAGAIPAQ